ncbi:hypothetical protein P280DRAFT_521006 [Massarina eburnea CBS 473.64]|uniref:Uncharacterized protein n=1 Tax=Massarina eburnea CBS 473.64 TaxID=1395130 RepID=A0A6A6RSH0_9PLEO|nr:hypothetical protein P280DRAFT_521006 [Massarina eburnea CBS 473.64]
MAVYGVVLKLEAGSGFTWSNLFSIIMQQMLTASGTLAFCLQIYPGAICHISFSNEERPGMLAHPTLLCRCRCFAPRIQQQPCPGLPQSSSTTDVLLILRLLTHVDTRRHTSSSHAVQGCKMVTQFHLVRPLLCLIPHLTPNTVCSDTLIP